jgi:hypothetical protein
LTGCPANKGALGGGTGTPGGGTWLGPQWKILVATAWNELPLPAEAEVRWPISTMVSISPVSIDWT